MKSKIRDLEENIAGRIYEREKVATVIGYSYHAMTLTYAGCDGGATLLIAAGTSIALFTRDAVLTRTLARCLVADLTEGADRVALARWQQQEHAQPSIHSRYTVQEHGSVIHSRHIVSSQMHM